MGESLAGQFLPHTCSVDIILEISGMDMKRTMAGTPSHVGKGLVQGASVMIGSIAEGNITYYLTL